MAPSIDISDGHDGVVTVTLTGAVGRDDVRHFSARWPADRAVRFPLAVVIDASRLDVREMTRDDIQSLARMRLPLGVRVAVVAGTTVCYGLARMYEMLHETIEPRSHVAVFHTIAGALCWLATGDPIAFAE